MSHLARWFVVLGVLAVLPAAVLLGAGMGEMLRHPSLGPTAILRHEALVIGLAVAATFLFSTAAGLRESRTWALVLARGLALVLVAAGAALVLLNARLMAAIGLPEVLVLALLPLALGALVFGARLSRALWLVSRAALPLGRGDVRALATLLAVAIAGTLGHLVVSRLAG